MFRKPPKKSKKVKRNTVDRVFGALASGVYLVKVIKAYVEETSSGALMFKLELLPKGSNKPLRVSECFQSSDDKGNKVYYTDSEGEDHDLPGYAKLNDYIVCIMGEDAFNDEDEPMDIFDLHEFGEIEKKKVKLYDYKAKKEIPQEKQVIVPFIGATLKVGVLKIIENTPAKDSDGKFVYVDGKVVTTSDTREVNEIAYIFDSEGYTANEIINQVEEPEFINVWLDKYENNVINRAKKGSKASGGKKRKPMDIEDVFND